LMNEVLHDRTLIETQTGHFGIGPNSMKSGDLLVAFHGAETPYALRRVEAEYSNELQETEANSKDFNEMTAADIKERWELIGPCYLHGFMDNEALQPEYDGKRQMFFIQ
jgi:hypothetical protein